MASTGRGKKNLYLASAQSLYVVKGRTLEQIAELLKISVTTLSGWKQEFGWADQRAAYLVSSESAVYTLRESILNMIRDIKDSGQIDTEKADQLSKLVAVMNRLDKENDSLGNTIAVMDRFADFLCKKYPEQAKALVPIIQEFFNEGVR